MTEKLFNLSKDAEDGLSKLSTDLRKSFSEKKHEGGKKKKHTPTNLLKLSFSVTFLISIIAVVMLGMTDIPMLHNNLYIIMGTIIICIFGLALLGDN